MANHNELGKLGEEIAQKFLVEQGFEIKACNWRWGHAELDLIVFKASVYIFVEVKTRKNSAFGYPEEAVGRQKEKKIYQAAAEYLYRQGHEGEFRFDIIAITLEPKLKIEHFPDAFFPGW